MNYADLFESLNQAFAYKFTTSYKKINRGGKNRLLRCMPSFYRRWFFTSFAEDATLSPCALLATAKNESREDMPFFIPAMPSVQRFGPMTFRTEALSLDNHPIVRDLRLLLQSCTPDFELDEYDFLMPEHEDALLLQLSIGDHYYIEYLVLICLHLNLFVKIPSIHSNRAQVSAQAYERVCALSDRALLDEIVQSAIFIATESLIDFITLDGEAETSYVTNLLQEPMETDDIFRHIFKSLGITVEQLATLQEDTLMDETVESMITGTFLLGITIDQFFFTPFGFYLRFIDPVYMLSYDLQKEMLYTLEVLDEGADFGREIFAPCSRYSLSSLGRQYFNIDIADSDEQKSEAALPDIPVDLFVRHLAEGAPLSTKDKMLVDSFITKNYALGGRMAYEIKVSVVGDKAFWKRLVFLENDTLHDVYCYICYEFNLNPLMEYCFFLSEEPSPFTAYAPPSMQKRAKDSTTAVLAKLHFSPPQTFLLVLRLMVEPSAAQNSAAVFRTLELKLELLSFKERSMKQTHPFVKSEGQVFRQ